MQAYARSLADHPELADLVAGEANGEEGMEVDGAGAEGRGAKRKRIYEDHRPMSSITAGIKAGTLHQVRSCCLQQADCFVDVCTRKVPMPSLSALPCIPAQLETWQLLCWQIVAN